jgi:hypothetical protein
MDKKQAIIGALYTFIGQRPGLEYGNYGDVPNYRAEVRAIGKDLTQARELLRYVELRASITGDDIIAASERAYSGRLSIVARDSFECMSCAHKWTNIAHVADVSDLCPKCKREHVYHRPAGFAVDYCTGQYFPTEYRKAVCAVLSQAIWNWTSAHAMPAPTLHHNSETGETVQRFKGLRVGDYLRASFKREFGRGMASRWFN